MAHMIKVFGVEEIKSAMKKASLKLGHSFGKGLMKGGLFLQRKSQQIVPIEFGVLKGSAGTRAIGSGWLMAVYVFYTASYAVYVHEIITNKHKKGKSAKFLEIPARKYRKQILKIIAGEAEKI